MDISTLSQKEVDIAKQALDVIVNAGGLADAALISMSNGDESVASNLKSLLVDSECARWNNVSATLRPTDKSKDLRNTNRLQYLYDKKQKELKIENLDIAYKNKAINNMRFTRIISIVAIIISLLSLALSLICN